VFNAFDNDLMFGGVGQNPARQTFVGFGYDPESYISTAQLFFSPYVTQDLIAARIGGMAKLIEFVDDSHPPTGSLDVNSPPNNPAAAVLASIIQNVTTEINGYLSSIYPVPLAQTGTVAIVRVTTVSTAGGITAIEVVDGGNYCVAPATANTPVYLRHLDPLANERFLGLNWQICQTGTGAALTVAYVGNNYSDESGQTLQAQTVSGTPTISTAGTGYLVGELFVLTGGSSFVPAKVREAALVLICHDLMQRRLAPDELNTFKVQARKWRGERDTDGMLTEIGEGNMQLDGTYKRFFSAGAVWAQRSVLFGANGL
jgi:hypothetical protein